MDLEVRTMDGYRPSFILAALQAVGYWLTLYVFAPLLLWSFLGAAGFSFSSQPTVLVSLALPFAPTIRQICKTVR